MKAWIVFVIFAVESLCCSAAKPSEKAELAQALKLTSPMDYGGGGCTGETKLFLLPDRGLDVAMRITQSEGSPVERITSSGKPHFLSTVGCANDAVAVGVNGTTYVLKIMRVEKLGQPPIYMSESSHDPRVTIKALETVHERYIKETDCTETITRTQVRVALEGRSRVVRAFALTACP